MRNIKKLPKESNHDFAYRVIKDNIINLEIKPGTLISEQDIADELGLSRTPVHEALQELSRTRIIEVRPQRGSFVNLIDMDLIEESLFMRSTLESAITETACENATIQQLQELEENLTLQIFYLEKNNLEKIMELDNSFHEMMYKITNKMQCYYIVKTMNIHYDRFRELRLHVSKPDVIVQEHKLILEAFKNHNSQLAKELCVSHLNRLHLDAKEVMKKYPEYFKQS